MLIALRELRRGLKSAGAAVGRAPRMAWWSAVNLVALLIVALLWVSPGGDLNHPPPRMAGTSLTLSTQKPSFLAATISVDYQQISEQLAEDALQGINHTGTQMINEVLYYSQINTGFYDDLKVYGRGRDIFIELPVDFDGKLSRQPGPDGRESFGFGGKSLITLSFRARITPDWRLNLEHGVNFDWRNRPTLRVLGISFPARGLAERLIRQTINQEMIRLNQEVNTEIKPKMEQVWTRLGEPILLSENPDIWLLFEPEDVYLSPLYTSSETLRIDVGLFGNLSSHFEFLPELPPAKPLPPLNPDISASQGFSLTIPVALPYLTIEEEFQKRLSYQNFSGRYGWWRAKIRDVNVYPSGDLLVVAFYVNSRVLWLIPANHRFYMSLSPEIDPLTEVLEMKNFTAGFYSPETALIRPFIAGIDLGLRSQLGEVVRLPLSEHLERGLTELNSNLNSGDNGFSPGSHIEKLGIEDFRLGERDMVVTITSFGKIRYNLKL